MKCGGLHALSHHDDDDNHDSHCVICEHIATQNTTPILTPDVLHYDLEVTVFFLDKELSENHTFSISKMLCTHQLLSRPPPYLA